MDMFVPDDLIGEDISERLVAAVGELHQMVEHNGFAQKREDASFVPSLDSPDEFVRIVGSLEHALLEHPRCVNTDSVKHLSTEDVVIGLFCGAFTADFFLIGIGSERIEDVDVVVRASQLALGVNEHQMGGEFPIRCRHLVKLFRRLDAVSACQNLNRFGIGQRTGLGVHERLRVSETMRVAQLRS
jgi:hypothetical protein